MPLFDLTLEELRKYRPALEEPRDFDGFWQATLAETRSHPLSVARAAETPLGRSNTFDLPSPASAAAVRGWLLLPRRREGRLPCVVEFLGDGGGGATPTDWLLRLGRLRPPRHGHPRQGSAGGGATRPDPRGGARSTPLLTRGLPERETTTTAGS
jgi:cephalosporin-C deacetylase